MFAHCEIFVEPKVTIQILEVYIQQIYSDLHSSCMMWIVYHSNVKRLLYCLFPSLFTPLPTHSVLHRLKPSIKGCKAHKDLLCRTRGCANCVLLSSELLLFPFNVLFQPDRFGKVVYCSSEGNRNCQRPYLIAYAWLSNTKQSRSFSIQART